MNLSHWNFDRTGADHGFALCESLFCSELSTPSEFIFLRQVRNR